MLSAKRYLQDPKTEVEKHLNTLSASDCSYIPQQAP